MPGREIWTSALRLTARDSGEEAAALRSWLLLGRSIPASTHRAAIMSSLAGRTAPFLWVASSHRPPRPSRWPCLWSLPQAYWLNRFIFLAVQMFHPYVSRCDGRRPNTLHFCIFDLEINASPRRYATTAIPKGGQI